MPRRVVLLAVLLSCSKQARRDPGPNPTPTPTPVAVIDSSTPDAALASGSDFCNSDQNCDWDNPCVANRCLGVKQKQPRSCDKSREPPGDCRCLDHVCTLQPKQAAAGPGCSADSECRPDFGGGVCVKGGPSGGPITTEGPFCRCAGGTCQLEWSAPVACQSFKDCSWTREGGRLRPVPASQVPRPVPQPVRPCKDGERDSVCGQDHVCHIVSWSC
jgi:hypothetical protein